MGDRQRAEGLDISAFLGFLRRRGLVVMLAIIVGAVTGYALSNSKEPEYEAKANLLLRGAPSTTPSENFEPGVPESASDRENLVLSDAVLGRAARRLEPQLGRERAQAAVSGVGAFSGQESEAVEISSRDRDPEVAARVANAVANAAIADRRDTALARIRRAEAAAVRQVNRLAGAGPEATTAIQEAQSRLQDLRQAAAVQDGSAEVTDRATAPSEAVSPKPGRDAFIGAFAGLFFGLAVAMIWEQLDRRVKHSRELEDLFGLPVLASVPKSRSLARRNGAALDELPPSDAEAFQMLRANLRFLNTDRELRSVVVTSPSVGDGKSTVSVNLAKADASVGKKVLLIEADMRRPRLGNILGIEPGGGLAAYLSNASLELVDVAHRVPVAPHANGARATMDVVVAGSVPSNPSELINSGRMQDLLREAEGDYELVVIDTSPAGIVADAIPLMSQATAVVIVGRVGRITGSEAGSLREQLERIDAPAFGLVANFAPAAEQSYGYY